MMRRKKVWWYCQYCGYQCKRYLDLKGVLCPECEESLVVKLPSPVVNCFPYDGLDVVNTHYYYGDLLPRGFLHGDKK